MIRWIITITQSELRRFYISGGKNAMIKYFTGINISSKDPKRLILFYKDILGIPVLDKGISEYDGVAFGFVENAPVFCIWDENKWENTRNSQGIVCLVFKCDDHEKTYNELKAKGVSLEPPTTVSWGDAKELFVKDPDGNTVYIL
jgi:catechol 2,3-dioxygenase-like lactoylglutathione lyase family enzyme